MEPYQALTGGALTPEQQMALVEALRRRRALGEIGALTGDRVMSPFGNNMIKQADSYAGQVQDIRQRDADNAQTERYQTGQLEHMGNVLNETIRENDMRDATTRRGQDMDLEAAKYRATNSGGKPARLRQTDINFLRDNAQAISSTNRMINFLQKGGKLGAVGGIPVVGSVLRQSLNKAASMGAGTKDSKETALMWQNYRRFYDLAERNNMFGATLTPNEQRAWDAANPSMTQDDAQIGEALKIMQKVYAHARDTMIGGLKEEGYSPEAIDQYSRIGEMELPNGEVPDGFDLEAAQQYLMEHPDTLPQFQEMLRSLGLDPLEYTPAM